MMKIDYVLHETSLGWMLLAQTDKGICALILDDDIEVLRQALYAEYPQAEYTENPQALAKTLEQVLPYIEAPTQVSNLPLDIPKGTAFQQAVWQALCEIPLGQTSSYKELAERLGRPKAFRAVGGACGSNPVAVLVPCHRVLTTDGRLGGYSLGLDRKKVLLAREGVRPHTNAASKAVYTASNQTSLLDE